MSAKAALSVIGRTFSVYATLAFVRRNSDWAAVKPTRIPVDERCAHCLFFLHAYGCLLQFRDASRPQL
tara:strand:- start:2869 stop:3072 length:204 start_codon:yes stop_codon:yes gene_type:complete